MEAGDLAGWNWTMRSSGTKPRRRHHIVRGPGVPNSIGRPSSRNGQSTSGQGGAVDQSCGQSAGPRRMPGRWMPEIWLNHRPCPAQIQGWRNDVGKRCFDVPSTQSAQGRPVARRCGARPEAPTPANHVGDRFGGERTSRMGPVARLDRRCGLGDPVKADDAGGSVIRS